MNFSWRSSSHPLHARHSVDSPGSGGHSGATAGDAEEPDDAPLVAKAQAGDQAAFEQLVVRHRGRVYSMVLNMVKNNADAWDLSQEIFVKAWKALPKFKAEAKFSTWLYRITHNAVYDFSRKRKLHSAGELDDNLLGVERLENSAPTAPNQPQRPDQALKGAELKGRIEKALAKLSDKHREVVVLREVQGMDYKEIAEIMECSTGTVMSRLFYARKQLQDDLKDEYTA